MQNTNKIQYNELNQWIKINKINSEHCCIVFLSQIFKVLFTHFEMQLLTKRACEWNVSIIDDNNKTVTMAFPSMNGGFISLKKPSSA